MKGLCSLGIVTLLVLAFGALPLPASADGLCLTQNAAEPLWMTRPSGGGGGVSAQTTCVADCKDGTSVSVINCQGTCTATDSNCPSYAGYVTCNGVYTYCNACPVPPDCEQTNGTYCSPRGSTKACRASDGGNYTCDCLMNHWVCPY
jgi:hypothetical protein